MPEPFAPSPGGLHALNLRRPAASFRLGAAYRASAPRPMALPIPDDCRYADSHEYARAEGESVRVGIKIGRAHV